MPKLIITLTSDSFGITESFKSSFLTTGLEEKRAKYEVWAAVAQFATAQSVKYMDEGADVIHHEGDEPTEPTNGEGFDAPSSRKSSRRRGS